MAELIFGKVRQKDSAEIVFRDKYRKANFKMNFTGFPVIFLISVPQGLFQKKGHALNNLAMKKATLLKRAEDFAGVLLGFKLRVINVGSPACDNV